MDKENILYKLGDSVLKWPKGLRDYIYRETDYKTTNCCRTYYINTLEIWHDLLLMRTFAYKVGKNNRPYGMPIQEVCRRLEGETYVLLCNIESGLSGRRVYYSENGKWLTKRNNDYYITWYTAARNNWWFYDYDMFDVNVWINKLNIPYCGYLDKRYTLKMPFFEYYEYYKKYPKIELLAKSGMGHLITGSRYFNFKGKSFEQVFKINKYWSQHMNKLDVSDILFIRKLNILNYEDLIIMRKLKRYSYVKKYYCKRMLKYISENCNLSLYNDYLRFCEELGMNMMDHRVLYVDDIKASHDEMMKKIKVNKSESMNRGIEKTANKLSKYKYQDKEFIVIPAKSYDDLAKESEVLNHCVRTYADRVAKGETGIMLLRKLDEIDMPFVTIELKGKTVMQARTKSNSIPPSKAQDFIRKWEKKYKLMGY